jgi:hypothetical protein
VLKACLKNLEVFIYRLVIHDNKHAQQYANSAIRAIHKSSFNCTIYAQLVSNKTRSQLTDIKKTDNPQTSPTPHQKQQIHL